MKKLFIYSILLSVFSLNTALALNHSAGKVNASQEEKNMVWSTANWYSTGDFETKPLRSKPGPNDSAGLRWGSYTLTVDTDVNVGSFGVGDGSKLICKKRNFKTKRDFSVSIPSSGETVAEFYNSSLISGGSLKMSTWDRHRSNGIGRFYMENSKAEFSCDINTYLPVNPLNKNKNMVGSIIELVGNSTLNFEGGTIIDQMISEKPNEWMFRFKFIEKDGKVPSIFFGKKADLTGCDYEIKLSGNLKAGKYPLITFQDRKSGLGKIKRMSLNGSKYELGQEKQVDGKTVKVYLAPAPGSKDSKTENDLVLEVK